MRTAWCLVVAIFLFNGTAHDCRAQSNTPAYQFEEQTNDGKFHLLFTNLVATNVLPLGLTNTPLPILSTNLMFTNIFMTTTNVGPWGPGGPPVTPPRKPWYRRWWDWFKGLF